MQKNETTWSDHEIEMLRTRYPNESTSVVAYYLQKSTGSVYSKARRIGLKKSEKFNKSKKSGRFIVKKSFAVKLLNFFRKIAAV